MGIVIVDICESSFINNLDIEAIIESEYTDVAVLKSDCLSICGLCARRPYAIVNGKRISAETPEECLNLIRKQIEAELAFFE